MLSLRTADAVAIGIDVGTSRTVVGTSDLAGRVLEQIEFETKPKPHEMINETVAHASLLFQKNGGTIEGIGVSLPGLVDQENDRSDIPYFKWHDLPLGEELKAEFRVPVTLDNDANAAALAELWFGRPEIREVRDFIMVLVEEGLGTGIVFDGQVYKGEAGAAGEFGHMTIGVDAPVACSYGRRECWESFSSERAALARYARLSGNSNKISCNELIDLAAAGNASARLALTETAYYLGIGIANLIQGLAPEAVIVGGPIVRGWSLMANEVDRAVHESICRSLAYTPIIASTLGPQPTLMGAISLVLASKFASISLT